MTDKRLEIQKKILFFLLCRLDKKQVVIHSPNFLFATFPCFSVGWSNFAQLPPKVCRIACLSQSLDAGLFIISPFQDMYLDTRQLSQDSENVYFVIWSCYKSVSHLNICRLKTAMFKVNINVNILCIFNMHISVHRPFVFILWKKAFFSSV